MKLRQPKCGCCKDAKVVLTATGTLRPCSRCNTEAYEVWAKSYFVPDAAGRAALESQQGSAKQ